MSKFTPREYQVDICSRGSAILLEHKLLILNMEVRTGKTLTAFMIADKIKAKKVLFVTKKKIIESRTIIEDYELMEGKFHLIEINLESVYKISDSDIDLIILDESHRISGYPKASLGAKRMREIVGFKNMILLTGTFSPESYSQVYHQLWPSFHSPFKEYKSFYKWAHQFVNIKQKWLPYGRKANDYSDARIGEVSKYIDPIMIIYTQVQAGFKSKINEHILTVEMKKTTYNLANKLIKDLVVESNGIVVEADTPVSLQQKLHQIYSGTIKIDDDRRIIIDDSKALFIKSYFKGKKLGIFYKFIAEKKLLEKVFGDTITNNLDEFNNTDKSYYGQIISSREGISLRNADALVYYNLDFSAISYLQSRDRMTTINSDISDVYFVFSEGGIEEKIYNTVLKKKSYTTYYFKRDFL